MTRPILIVSLPRSGSSMVAGVFARHGVWTGTCTPPDQWNPRGYYENVRLNELIGGTVGHVVTEGTVPDPPDGWREMVHRELRGDGYRGGPWLFKCAAVYWRLFEPFNPRWVVVRRDLRSVLASGSRSGRYRAPTTESVIAHQRAMDTLEREYGAVRIDANRLIAGDYQQLEQALFVCGIPMDRRTVEEWIDPDLWGSRKG